jgi:hypothetical protein
MNSFFVLLVLHSANSFKLPVNWVLTIYGKSDGKGEISRVAPEISSSSRDVIVLRWLGGQRTFVRFLPIRWFNFPIASRFGKHPEIWACNPIIQCCVVH